MRIYVILVLLEHMQGCKGPALHVLQVVDYMAIEKLSLSLLRYLYTRFHIYFHRRNVFVNGVDLYIYIHKLKN